MQRRTLAKWLVFTALVCFGLFLAAGSSSAQEGNVVQGQNGSTDSDAASETATAENDLTFTAGPAAGGLGAPSQSAQNGDNAGNYSQNSEARSGDAAAGSQVRGAVGGSGAHQAQNTSDGAVAVSGPVTASNFGEVALGPGSLADGSAAQSSQVGDNRLDASQTAIAVSGDAVAGSQVSGFVGGGDNASQLQNTALDPLAETGEVEVINETDITVGPQSATEDAEAQASQVGDNDVVLRQSSIGTSGDALAGAQVSGGVGNGSTTTQGQSSSTDAESTSGEVFVFNAAFGIAVGPIATTGGETAQASQNGDNSADIDQEIQAASGDAVAGSQVVGLVSSEAGSIEVQNQQASDGDIAISGTVDSGNEIDGLSIGPSAEALDAPAQASHDGDNALAFSQSATLASGDAVAGSQVTSAVSPDGDVTVQNQNDSIDSESISGDVGDGVANTALDLFVGPQAFADAANAQASQSGDNAVAFDQVADLASGDAVAGSQVTGFVSDPSDVSVQAQNSSDGALSESGSVLPGDVNIVEGFVAGPAAEALDETAAASQVGDNAFSAEQHAGLASGDAVAGSQVTGIVADHGDATAQLQNSSVDSETLSGEVAPDVVNSIVEGAFGPQAVSDAAPALASQNGDNSGSVDQHADLASGDAVAGAQVTGIVTAHGEVTVQNQNDSDGDISESGEVAPAEVNTFETFGAGPVATSLDETAAASQIGDNSFDVTQAATAASGDAVAGAQVTGVVASGSDVTVQNQSTSVDSEALTGSVEADVFNSIVEAFAGPSAVSDAANAASSQNGDNDVSLAQVATATTGDAVAGAQVTGAVVSGGTTTIQNQNDSDGALAESGASQDGVIANEIAVLSAGPVAEAVDDTASAAQVGDNSVAVAQSSNAASGDAVAGAQVTGVVADDDVTVQNQNVSIDAETLTGEVTAENLAEDIFVGPFALADGFVASVVQNGDDSLDLGQDADATSGDAVAGAQITGVITLTDPSVQLQNFDDGSVAETFEAGTFNSATGSVGPQATAEDDVADAAQLGDSNLSADQIGDAHTGDAVAGGQVTGLAA